MIAVFPANDREQTIRLRRFFMAAALYGIWIAFGVAGHLTGLIAVAGDTLAWFCAGVALTTAAFYLLIRSGLNRRLPDPSMTFLQCVVGLTWLIAFMHVVPPLRELLLSVYVVVVMFGIFGMRRREFFSLSFIAFLGYLAVIGLDYLVRPEAIDLGAETLRAAVLGSVLIWVSFFGSHVSALRRRLRLGNRQLHTMVEEMTRLAERDHLTQAFNRRYVVDKLEQYRAAADRYGQPFSIAILDIDHFKRVNDEHGHLTGDTVLSQFADCVKTELRRMDEVAPAPDRRSLGRYGGEEFILMLPHTRLEDALNCAERVRETISAHDFRNGIEITVSIGVAEYRRGESIEDLLRRADEALYHAKGDGRDRVETMMAAGDTGEVVSLSEYQREMSTAARE